MPPQEASADHSKKSAASEIQASEPSSQASRRRSASSSSSGSNDDDQNQDNSAAFSCSLAISPPPPVARSASPTNGQHDQQASSRSSLVIDFSAGGDSVNQSQEVMPLDELPLEPRALGGAKVSTTCQTDSQPKAEPPAVNLSGFRAKFENSRANNMNMNMNMNNKSAYRMEIFSATNSENTQTACEDSTYSVSTGKAGLLYHNREPLRLKDFSAEVRGPMDVEQFSHQAELLLDLNEISMEGIIEAMLEKVASNDCIKRDKLSEIRDAIFIPGSSVLMARTIQGFQSVVEFQERGHHSTVASLRHDQSWLCALCNLSQVSKRHMVVARFKHPVNMGENAHEIRLFVLIIVPTKEKSTKDQVETGRTFATMLTDANFRQRLLHAQSETEFKSLMMAKAQQLALAQRLKNRHKYRLDPILRESISSNSLDGGAAAAAASGAESRCARMLTTGGSDVFSPTLSGAGKSVFASPESNSRRDEDEQPSRLFCRNPRTSKLFELITDANNNNSNNSQQARDKKQLSAGPEVEFIDPKRLEKMKDKERQQGDRKDACCGGIFANLEFGKGFADDFAKRLKFYPSDFRDAFVGPPRTLQKTVATIWFLYFGILLPTIAFSSLNTVQTHGHMGDLRKAIIGQAIGGLGFALFGGQPLVIIMTTAPLCLYTKVIHQMCLDYGFPFPAMYAAVGLWNGLFLIIYSLFGFSKLMKWCSRSTEEIFALFIVVAFVTDAGKDMLKNFKRFYYTPACEAQNERTTNVMIDANQTMIAPALATSATNASHAFRDIEDEIESSVCRRETSLLFVLLMLGTLWLAVTLYKFRRTPYLSAGKRDILADYALPTAVIIMSLIGSTVFDDIYVEKFPPLVDIHFERARVDQLPWTGVLTAMGLGFTLSLLFFMDQNISAAMVMAPQNKLKKGSAYHYDLLIVGVLNGFLSLYGLPMMHGVLPHSPLHARSLADIEEQVEEGHLREVVVNCRETRVTGIVAHILVLLSLLLIPYPIAYIPRAVLNGLFLYMAVTSLDGLQVFERILLLFTEQSKYPPNHYIRRCPQRKIHQFTFLQIIQLIVMCLFGFSPINIVEMFFPVFILLMIPFRHKIVPKYIDEKYLDALDGKH